MNAHPLSLVERFGRIWRYVLVGGGVTLAYSLLTAAFIMTRVIADPVTASAVATIVTQPFAFLSHRAITYRDVTRQPGHGKRFAFIAVSSFILNLAVIKVAGMLDWPFWIGLAIGWVVIPIANYLIGAIWVFRVRRLMAMTAVDRSEAPTARAN